GSNGLLVVCADQAHNLYGFLFEPTFEMVPCQGRTKDDVMKFTCPVRVKRPVAPVKRPVPPVTIAVSWLSNTLGVAVGVRYPEKRRVGKEGRSGRLLYRRKTAVVVVNDGAE